MTGFFLSWWSGVELVGMVATTTTGLHFISKVKKTNVRWHRLSNGTITYIVTGVLVQE